MNKRCRWLMTLLVALLVAVVAPVTARAQVGGGDEPSDVSDLSGLPDGMGIYDCNPAHVLCDGLEPLCLRAGTVPSVVGSCWGECVEFSQCQPIACDGNDQCPGGSTYCHRTGLCASGSDCNILLEFPPVCDDDEAWLSLAASGA